MTQHLTSEEATKPPFEFNAYLICLKHFFSYVSSELRLPTLPRPPEGAGHFYRDNQNYLHNASLDKVKLVLNNAAKHGPETLREQADLLPTLHWAHNDTSSYCTADDLAQQGALRLISSEMQLVPIGAHPPQSWTERLALFNTDNGDFPLPVLYRTLGSAWPPQFLLKEVQELLIALDAKFSPDQAQQKAYFHFIMAFSFQASPPTYVKLWKKELEQLQSMLRGDHQADLLKLLAQCCTFTPLPSLTFLQKQLSLFNTLLQNGAQINDLSALLTLCASTPRYDKLLQNLQLHAHKLSPAQPLFPLRFARAANVEYLNHLFPNIEQYREFLMLASAVDTGAPEGTPATIPEWTQEKLNNFASAVAPITRSNPAILTKLSQMSVKNSTALENCDTIVRALTPLPPITQLPDAWIEQKKTQARVFQSTAFSDDAAAFDDLINEGLLHFCNNKEIPNKINKAVRDLSYALATGVKEKALNFLVDLNDLSTLLSQTPTPKEALTLKLNNIDTLLRDLFSKEHTLALGYSAPRLIQAMLKPEGEYAPVRIGIAIIDKIAEINREKLSPADKRTFVLLKDFQDNGASLLRILQDLLVENHIKPTLNNALLEFPEFPENLKEAIRQCAQPKPSQKLAGDALNDYRQEISAITKALNTLQQKLRNTPTQKETILRHLQTLLAAPFDKVSIQVTLSLLDLAIQAEASAPIIINRFKRFLSETDASVENLPFAIEALRPLLQAIDAPEERSTYLQICLDYTLKVQITPQTPAFPFESLQKIAQRAPAILHAFLSLLKQSPTAELVNAIAQTVQLLPQHSPLLSALLQQIHPDTLAEDINTYSAILSALAHSSQTVQTILQRLTEQNDTSRTLARLRDIQTRLNATTPEIIKKIHDQLFLFSPYPSVEQFIEVLSNPAQLDAYCKQFDLDPKATETYDPKTHAISRTPRAFEDQFSMNQVQTTLAHMKDLTQGLSLPFLLQLKLARQLTYIETLGYTNATNPDDPKKQGLNTYSQLSRKDLRVNIQALLRTLRQTPASSLQGNNPAAAIAREKQQLQLLALLREAFFRSTGLFPNTTQMLSLLLAMHDHHHLLMQINTGEGKSLLTPLLAVLQYAEGGTVDVCTANPLLAERDYYASYLPLFSCIGLADKASFVKADSETDTYKDQGINISTFKNLTLFRKAQALQHKKLNPETAPLHLVLDESDAQTLDLTSLLTLVHADMNKASRDPEDWLYRLIDKFAISPEHQKIEGEEAWDQKEDLQQLLYTIQAKIATNPEQKKLFQRYEKDPESLRPLLKAACRARRLIQDKDFLLQEGDAGPDGLPRLAVLPLEGGVPETSGIFPDHLQEALLARFSNEKNQHYFIPYNPSVLAYESTRHLIQETYQKTNGRLLGLSGTVGADHELAFLSSQYSTKAYGIPHHAGDHRTIHGPQFAETTDDNAQKILSLIKQARRPSATLDVTDDMSEATRAKKKALWINQRTPPVLIITEDFAEAKTCHQKVQQWYNDHPQPVYVEVAGAGAADLKAYQQKFNALKKEGPPFDKMTLEIGQEDPEKRAKMLKKGFFCTTISAIEELQAALEKSKCHIELIEGTEPRTTLDAKIDRAGEHNVITIGTKILGRGVDVRPKHKDGLIVIQNYQDTLRSTDQSKGRTGRQGKKGEFHMVYTVKRSGLFLDKVKHALIPGYTQRYNLEKTKQTQDALEEQTTVRRLYTEYTAHLQEVLTQEFNRWEAALINCDPTLEEPCLQLRKKLLNQARLALKTNVSYQTLDTAKSDYKKALFDLWETFKTVNLTPLIPTGNDTAILQQQFTALSAYSLDEALLQEAQPHVLKAFEKDLDSGCGHSLEMAIANKAGAVMTYGDAATELPALHKAQMQQLLPYFIHEITDRYPGERTKIGEILESRGNKHILEEFFQNFHRTFDEFQHFLTQINPFARESERQKRKNTYIGHLRTLLNKDNSTESELDEAKVGNLMEHLYDFITHKENTASFAKSMTLQNFVVTFTHLYEQYVADMPTFDCSALQQALTDLTTPAASSPSAASAPPPEPTEAPPPVGEERAVSPTSSEGENSLGGTIALTPKDTARAQVQKFYDSFMALPEDQRSSLEVTKRLQQEITLCLQHKTKDGGAYKNFETALKTLQTQIALFEKPLKMNELKALKTSYEKELILRVADYLQEEFEWSTPDKETTTWLNRKLESDVIISTCQELYHAATALKDAFKPDPPKTSEEKIAATREFYQFIHEKQLFLKTRYPSWPHKSPKLVVQQALDAIEFISHPPAGLDPAFREQAHDTALIKACLEAFMAKPMPEDLRSTLSLLRKNLGDTLGTVQTFITYLDNELSKPDNTADTQKALQKLRKNLRASLAQFTDKTHSRLHQTEILSPDFVKKMETYSATFFGGADNVSVHPASEGFRKVYEVQIRALPDETYARLEASNKTLPPESQFHLPPTQTIQKAREEKVTTATATATAQLEAALLSLNQLYGIARPKEGNPSLDFEYTEDQRNLLSPTEKDNYDLKKKAEKALLQLQQELKRRSPACLDESLSDLIKSCQINATPAISGWLFTSYDYSLVIKNLNQEIMSLAGKIKESLKERQKKLQERQAQTRKKPPSLEPRTTTACAKGCFFGPETLIRELIVRPLASSNDKPVK